MKRQMILWTIASGAMLVIASGCTTLQPFPMSARAGDTITVPIGAADGVTRGNVTVNYVPDANQATSYDLTPNLRSISKLYADKRSGIYDGVVSPASQYLVQGSGHEPWEVVLTLDLPTNIPVGTGVIHVATSATYPNYNTTNWFPHVSTVPIALEILPGLGHSDSFTFSIGGGVNTQDISIFDPLPSAVVKPPNQPGWLTKQYGAIDMTFAHAIVVDGGVVNKNNIRVLTEDLTVNK